MSDSLPPPPDDAWVRTDCDPEGWIRVASIDHIRIGRSNKGHPAIWAHCASTDGHLIGEYDTLSQAQKAFKKFLGHLFGGPGG